MRAPFLISIFIFTLSTYLPRISVATENEPLQAQLIKAVRSGDSKLVEALLKKGADPNKGPLGEPFPPLDATVMDGYISRGSKIKIAQILIKAGAATPSESSLNYIFNQRLDEIMQAVNEAYPADPSVMAAAIKRGDLVLFERLVKLGYPLSKANIFVNPLISRATPLQAAIALNQEDIVTALVGAGCSFRPQDKMDGVSITNADLLARGSPEILKIFLEKGLNPSTKNSEGKNLLMLAAASGRSGSIHLLISKGAKVDAKDEYGDTPLMYAARFGTTETVRALLEHNPNLYLFGSGGQNAKVMAFYCEHPEIVEVLEQAGMEGYAGKGIPKSSFDQEVAGKFQSDITANVYWKLPFLPAGQRFFSVKSTSSLSEFSSLPHPGRPVRSAPQAFEIYAVLADQRVVKLSAPSDFQMLNIKIRSGRDALRLVRSFDSLDLREFMEIPSNGEMTVRPLDILKKAGMTEPKVKLGTDGKTFVIERFGLPISEARLWHKKSATINTMIRSVETIGREGQYSQTVETVPVSGILVRVPFIGER